MLLEAIPEKPLFYFHKLDCVNEIRINREFGVNFTLRNTIFTSSHGYPKGCALHCIQYRHIFNIKWFKICYHTAMFCFPALCYWNFSLYCTQLYSQHCVSFTFLPYYFIIHLRLIYTLKHLFYFIISTWKWYLQLFCLHIWKLIILPWWLYASGHSFDLSSVSQTIAIVYKSKNEIYFSFASLMVNMISICYVPLLQS